MLVADAFFFAFLSVIPGGNLLLAVPNQIKLTAEG
jgi:hypothetical protein